SMASPHVNGVVALIRAANPNLSVEMVKQIIYDTAYDLGPTGEDNSYGWGMIDAYEAVQVALSYLDGYGFIRGRVTDYETGVPLEGQLTVTNRDPQISARTRENGWYTLIVPADSVWEITCEVPNSLYVPKIDSMSVASGDTAFLNFRMMLPGVTMSMLPHNAPIIVHAGNSFTFTGVLESNSDQTQTTDVWIMLDVPGIGEYGPVQQFNNITLQPFQQLIAWSVAQYVPAFAPNGIYDYLGYCGDYPSIVVDTAQFSFTVYGGTLGSPDENDWKLAGWFDEGQPAELPSEFKLHGNVPNPFNAQTRIQFELPDASEVNLSVYNLGGQKVATLVDGYREAGVHNIKWDASSYSSGIYFYKLSAGDKVVTRKMSLLK
ncbi:MAG: T9SS type A sorting domain-containing protein, partial [candidate division Zixibacteria bacterium]|nr:T9SS type A sorting domain-containing protein [candidate division Zixibacteria bacterium]